MNPLQAIAIIIKYTDIIQLTRSQHIQLQQAITLVEKIVKEAQSLKDAKKTLDNTQENKQ